MEGAGTPGIGAMDRNVAVLRALGYEPNEALVLARLVTEGTSTRVELSRATNLSQRRLSIALTQLEESGCVEKADEESGRYALTPQFARRISAQIEEFSRGFVGEVERAVSTERKVINELKSLFMALGYMIAQPPKEGIRLPRFERRGKRREGTFNFDFIAEGYYRLGVVILDSAKLESVSQFVPDPGFILRSLPELEEISNCLTSIIFFAPVVTRDIKRLYLDGRRMARLRYLEARGMEGRAFFTINLAEDIRDQLQGHVAEIRQRTTLVQDLLGKINQELDEIKNLTVHNEFLSQFVESALAGVYLMLPGAAGETFREELLKIAEPIRDIVDREMRNHRIFERQYHEERVRIDRITDRFENRAFLPEVHRLEESLDHLRALKSKFEPIRFELGAIQDQIFEAQMTAAPGQRLVWNPFVFTEPYDPEGVTINQEEIKARARRFSIAVQEGLPTALNLLVGAAGTGKTHVLRYVYLPLLQKAHVLAIYVHCPMKLDLVAAITAELLQDSNFPERLRGPVAALRRRDTTTVQDLIDLVQELRTLARANGFGGFVLLLDELENLLPYGTPKPTRQDRVASQQPLALRQLKDVLRYRYGEGFGLVIAFRRGVLELVKDSLQMSNFDEFLIEPRALTLEEIQGVIKQRFKVWSSPPVQFTRPCLNRIIGVTEGVTRDIIKYCRELYSYARRRGLKRLVQHHVAAIEPLPLFRY